MNYWIARHYYPALTRAIVPLRVRRDDVAHGDKVLIYETKTRPRRQIGGKAEPGGSAGRGAVLGIYTINGELRDYSGPPETLGDGRTIAWSYEFNVGDAKPCHVPLAELRSLPGWGPRWNPRYNGDLRRLTEAQFEEFERHCKV